MTATDTPVLPTRYLDVADLRVRWPLSKTAIYDLVASPDWCARVRTLRIGDRIMFLEEDVLAAEASWVVTPEMAAAAAARRLAAKEAPRAARSASAEQPAASSAGDGLAAVHRPAMPPRKRAAYTRAKAA